MFETFIRALFTSPLATALIVLGVVCLGWAAIGNLPRLSGPRSRRSALRRFGVASLVGALGVAYLLTAVSSPPPAASTPVPTPVLDALVDIFAAQGWQDTPIVLQRGQGFQVQYTAGKWTDGRPEWFNGEGYGYICGRVGCVEPLPGAQRGALVGRVGTDIFLVGDAGFFAARSDGRLQLRMNDGDGGLYDNAGSLTVRIILKP